jgi:hypothetical protein
MPKSSPEKLAKALRANLKKRKMGEGTAAPKTPAPQAESRPIPPGPASRPKPPG